MPILENIRKRRPLLIGQGRLIGRIKRRIELASERLHKREILPTLQRTIREWEVGKVMRKITRR